MCTYNINYNDYNANLSDGLQSILASSEMSDVTLAVEGKYFKAHQVILSMFSTYFRELFHATPSRNTIFFMKNVKHRIMHNLLSFMYEGNVQIHSEDFQLFVDTANELKIKGLANDSDPKTAELPQEQDDAAQSSSQVSHTEDIIEPSLKRASEPMEQEAKKCKLSNTVPVQFTSEVSVLPLTTSQSDHQKIEETEWPHVEQVPSEDEDFEDKVNLVDIGPTEIHGLYDDTIDLDDDDDENTMTRESVANDMLATLNNEILQPPAEGEPVLVSLCLSRTTQKVKGVIWDDFRYYLHDECVRYSRWRCTAHGFHKCNAKLLWTEDGLITLNQGHNHGKRRIHQQSSTNVVSRTLYAVSYEYFKQIIFMPRGKKME